MNARRRLLLLGLGAPLLLVAVAFIYMLVMAALEGQSRDIWQALAWASETLTTTGYGADSSWSHPGSIVFVIVVQFTGVALTFVVFSLIVVPYFEKRFEGRLPRRVGRMRPYVLVYRFGPAVASLVDELARSKVPVVVLEEDPVVARRLLARGVAVVYLDLEVEDPDPELFVRARALVANGPDHKNGALVLSARQAGYSQEIVALAEHPLHRRPMMLAGATSVYTPLHILAAAMAALASERVSPRVVGMKGIRAHLHTAELRVSAQGELAGKTLAQAQVRARTGATIIGQWYRGTFEAHPRPHQRIEPGAILVAVGSERALSSLGKLATPIVGHGPFIVCGHGEVGRKLIELLDDAGEATLVVDRKAGADVHVVGDVLDPHTLARAEVQQARGVMLALGDDATTLFAASVIRDFAPEIPLVARVNRTENVQRIHRAGADFARSLGEVAAGLLAHRLIGDEWISLEARVKLVRVSAAGLEGSSPGSGRVGELTGCSVVALERHNEVLVDFADDFVIEAGDHLWICGPEPDIDRYYAKFPNARLET